MDLNLVMHCKYISITAGMYILSIYMSLITENFLASHGKVLYKKKRKRCEESYENAISVISSRETS